MVGNYNIEVLEQKRTTSKIHGIEGKTRGLGSN